MLRFNAQHFLRASTIIGQMHEQVRSGKMPSPESWGIVGDSIAALRSNCVGLQMDATNAQLARVNNLLNSSGISLTVLADAIMEVNIRMVDELECRTLYYIDSKNVPYLTSHQFASDVGERFPDAIPDMDEAARCFAFERPTACVFHLMRVTEYALREIADQIGIADHNPTWEPIIRKIDAEMKADYKDRKFKGEQDLLANMSTHLHAVKVAWRNKTMHVEKINTMEHAKEIYDATSGLMRYLAENLPHKKAGIVQSIRGALGGKPS